MCRPVHLTSLKLLTTQPGLLHPVATSGDTVPRKGSTHVGMGVRIWRGKEHMELLVEWK